MKQIATALIKAQKDMANPVKTAKNPFFKSSYADLNSVRDACLPVLNENGIAVMQPTITVDGKNYVHTILLHESGETIESMTEIIFKQGDAQAQGSGITYARRYGLQSLVCLGADDDDGNGASGKVKEAETKAKLEAISLQVNKCTTTDELTQIWASNVALQANEQFKSMVSEKGKSLKSKK